MENELKQFEKYLLDPGTENAKDHLVFPLFQKIALWDNSWVIGGGFGQLVVSGRAYSGGRVSPLRVATGGNANWRFESSFPPLTARPNRRRKWLLLTEREDEERGQRTSDQGCTWSRQS